MPKIDFTKVYKQYYTAKNTPEIIVTEPISYLSIVGTGDPSAQEFSDKVQVLYTVAYAIKFACKAKGNDFIVPKLEGLWWFDEQQYKEVSISEAPLLIPRNHWYYRLLIRMPEKITEQDVHKAIATTWEKKAHSLIMDTTLFRLHEGKCVQILHTGPFDREPETLEKMQAFMRRNGFLRNGYHHEIYLSDFRKTNPEKLRTILREPVL